MVIGVTGTNKAMRMFTPYYVQRSSNIRPSHRGTALYLTAHCSRFHICGTPKWRFSMLDYLLTVI